MIIELGVMGIMAIVIFYFIFQFLKLRKLGLLKIKDAIFKGKKLLFLESPTDFWIEVPENEVENVKFTKSGDMIITPPGTVKSCKGLGNVQVGHADLYLSACIPMDVPKFIEEKRKEGLNEDEIADEIDKIAGLYNKKGGEAIPEEYSIEKPKEQNIYKTYSLDNIKNFINSGLNRTILKRQVLTLIEMNKLDKMFGGRDWMKIVIPASILLIVIAVVFIMLSSSGVLGQLTGAGQMVHSTASAGANTIKP